MKTYISRHFQAFYSIENQKNTYHRPLFIENKHKNTTIFFRINLNFKGTVRDLHKNKFSSFFYLFYLKILQLV